jgi:hypothetical protein
MPAVPRPVRIHHCTSEPFRFFGRDSELNLLDRALVGGDPSVVALVGPGGQGKTAIVQHWLERIVNADNRPDGVFLWSFYRGKDADLCLRELYAYAEGLDQVPDVAASFCVDRLLSNLRHERWAVIFDGTEVVQYDAGSWRGRFVHPELGRLVEELASATMPGVIVLTTRFELPTLSRRHYAQVLSLSALDAHSARALLGSLGVVGNAAQLDAVAAAGGFHAKAVELLGTYLIRFHQGEAGRLSELPPVKPLDGASAEEQCVFRVLSAFQQSLPQDMQDVIALATAFRDPPTEARLVEYLRSPSVAALLHTLWQRTYLSLADRNEAELVDLLSQLIALRLLERVGRGGPIHAQRKYVIDAHPLVRRAFEHVLGTAGQRQTAQARAGFLRGRPDRRRPASLEEAREEVELFHAYCDAGLWNEADSAFVALDNPKHRFLAPALERDLLLRFFPDGDWQKPPLWPGFGRYRSLAICSELLGKFEDALAIYRDSDAALRGDALIALGRLEPLLNQTQTPHPWQSLWQAYRSHALCLAGRTLEAVAVARSLVPVDIYEWVHVFEGLLRAGQLAALDLKSVLFRPPHAAEQRWADLARRRMRADYLRVSKAPGWQSLGLEYQELLEAYDRGGLPYERCLTRLSYSNLLLEQGAAEQAESVNQVTLRVAQLHGMHIMEADSWLLSGEINGRLGDQAQVKAAQREAAKVSQELGCPIFRRP